MFFFVGEVMSALASILISTLYVSIIISSMIRMVSLQSTQFNYKLIMKENVSGQCNDAMANKCPYVWDIPINSQCSIWHKLNKIKTKIKTVSSLFILSSPTVSVKPTLNTHVKSTHKKQTHYLHPRGPLWLTLKADSFIIICHRGYPYIGFFVRSLFAFPGEDLTLSFCFPAAILF